MSAVFEERLLSENISKSDGTVKPASAMDQNQLYRRGSVADMASSQSEAIIGDWT